jgi:two-component system, NtrC family, sensor kinase
VSSLFVIRGNDQGARFELAETVLRLGRDSASAIQVHDTEVSRHHAELRRIDSDFVISDLNSANGTFVNGRRVRQHRLSSGDQLQVGRTLMLYTGPSEESDEDLARTVDIATAAPGDDQSRIIHSVPQKEGSRLFDQT